MHLYLEAPVTGEEVVLWENLNCEKWLKQISEKIEKYRAWIQDNFQVIDWISIGVKLNQ